MTPEELQEIRERCEAATEGPWTRLDARQCCTGFCIEPVLHGSDPDDSLSVADATFIAHARTDIPALLARVRELEAALTDCHQAMDGADSIDEEFVARIGRLVRGEL